MWGGGYNIVGLGRVGARGGVCVWGYIYTILFPIFLNNIILVYSIYIYIYIYIVCLYTFILTVKICDTIDLQKSLYEIKENFSSLMHYCALDCKATFEVFHKV